MFKEPDTAPLSDAELIQRIKRELPYQTHSFEMLVNRFQHMIYTKVCTLINDREEAREVTQDIFVKVFTALPALQHDRYFKTWLYSVTVNTCLNHIDKMKRRTWWASSDIDEFPIADGNETRAFMIANLEMEQFEARDLIEHIMSNMSDTSREIIQLRYREELDYQHIADRLNIGLSAAKMRIKRARSEFIQRYDQLKETDHA